MTKHLIARWESRSGKHYFDLYRDDAGSYSYSMSGGGGGYGFTFPTDLAAIEYFETRHVEWAQPDNNKTPMKRVPIR